MLIDVLIRKGPSLTASEFVTERVNLYEDEDQIDKAGEGYYYLHDFRACTSPSRASFRSFFYNSCITVKKPKSHTPSQSSQSSYAEFKANKQIMMEIARPS